jgi:hypothetical protein
MTEVPNDETAKGSHECECGDDWIDFEIILSRLIGNIGVIRYLEETKDDEWGTAVGEFFSSVKELHDLAEDLYAEYMSGSTCVYCGREPQSNWNEEERHDDIVFFDKDGKTASAHRFCRDEAVRKEAAAS